MGHLSAVLQLWLGFFPYFYPASSELMSYDHASDTAVSTGGKSAVKLVYVFINEDKCQCDIGQIQVCLNYLTSFHSLDS